MKYSVRDLERMRGAIWASYPYGIDYQRSERDADVERRLSTYMANGTTPEELEAYVDELNSERLSRFMDMQKAIGKAG